MVAFHSISKCCFVFTDENEKISVLLPIVKGTIASFFSENQMHVIIKAFGSFIEHRVSIVSQEIYGSSTEVQTSQTVSVCEIFGQNCTDFISNLKEQFNEINAPLNDSKYVKPIKCQPDTCYEDFAGFSLDEATYPLFENGSDSRHFGEVKAWLQKMQEQIFADKVCFVTRSDRGDLHMCLNTDVDKFNQSTGCGEVEFFTREEVQSTIDLYGELCTELQTTVEHKGHKINVIIYILNSYLHINDRFLTCLSKKNETSCASVFTRRTDGYLYSPLTITSPKHQQMLIGGKQKYKMIRECDMACVDAVFSYLKTEIYRFI